MKTYWFLFFLPLVILIFLDFFEIIFLIQILNGLFYYFLMFIFLVVYYTLLMYISEYEPSKNKVAIVIIFLSLPVLSSQHSYEYAISSSGEIFILQNKSNGDVTVQCVMKSMVMTEFKEIFRNNYRERVLVGAKIFFNENILTLKALNFNKKEIISIQIDYNENCSS